MTQPLFPDPHSSNAHLKAHDRPSLFDLLAQEQLRELFHPVIRYVLSYFAQRYPRYLLRLLNHHEEFFAALLLLLERYHLKKHNASISEHFYGLRLSSTSQNIPTPRLSALQHQPDRRKNLTRRQRWGILVFIVGIPYLRARAQDYYERLGGAQIFAEEGDVPERAVTTKQRIVKAIYPYANLALDGSFLLYDLAYLFGKTNYHRPWHKLLNLRIIRRGPDDSPEDTSFLSRLPPLLPPLLLLLKLSQWWYSPSSPRALSSLTSDRNTLASTHAAILPPRPLPILPQSGLLRAEDGDGDGDLPTGQTEGYAVGTGEYGKCPLCKKNWQNPAVLPSGWVVCWRCGWDAVEGDDDDDEDDTEQEGEGEQVAEDGKKVVNGNEKTSPSTSMNRSKRKGRCPITGVMVAPGELRRVLV